MPVLNVSQILHYSSNMLLQFMEGGEMLYCYCIGPDGYLKTQNGNMLSLTFSFSFFRENLVFQVCLDTQED